MVQRYESSFGGKVEAPGLDYVFTITCTLESPLEVGSTIEGLCRIVNISGGVVAGPRIHARIVPGGADWQKLRTDGVLELSAHYAMETDDGIFIQVKNRGLRHGPSEVLTRIANGEQVDPSGYYCRTSPIFLAPEGCYAWLNESVFVANAHRSKGAIDIQVFKVL